jgi:hypothetical protein
MTRIRVLILAAALAGTALPAAPQGQSPAQAAFQTGLTALHNFEYEQANEAFHRARTLDPAFVLAYWGEAMTWHQTLWRNENVESARRTLNDLAPTAAARAAKARTARERLLLAAAEALFGEGDADARRRRYVDAMAKAAAAQPDDPDITSLYALALLGTMSRSLIGFADAHDPALAGSELQTQVASILNRVLAAHPRHPGALHYLLHAYDDPEHARLALAAARTYASVAAAASHALHMPAHIFLQLGMWHDAAASDRASFDASTEWTRRRQLTPALRNYHALSWLQYEQLQLGRFAEAQAAIREIEPVANAESAQAHAGTHQPLLSDLSSMRARLAIETRRWSLMAASTTFGNANDLFAIGMSAARTGNLRSAQRVQQALAQQANAPQQGDLRPAIAIMEREMAALVEQASGRLDAAIAIMSAAAKSELALPAPLGLPLPIKPAPELLGEMLIDAKRPQDAIAPFEATLKRHANRSLSLLGLARAAKASGDEARAHESYRKLLANYDRADADVAEVSEARNAVAGAGQQRGRR